MSGQGPGWGLTALLVLAGALGGVAVGYSLKGGPGPGPEAWSANRATDVCAENRTKLVATLTVPDNATVEALGCLEVLQGDLIVGSSVSLLSFPNLREVSGSIEVGADLVTRILLPKLQRVGRDLTIYPNPTLHALELPQLVEVGDELKVEENPKLLQAHFPSLQSVGSFVLDSNATLSTTRLLSLKRVGGFFDVEANPRLTSIYLPSLDEVRGDFEMRENSVLREVRAPSLREVGGPVWLGTNAALETVLLPALTTIGGRVRLEELPALRTLELPGYSVDSVPTPP